MVLGPNLNRPARRINRLLAARARERDKRDDGVAVRHASELSVLSTHRAEGLAATNRWRGVVLGTIPNRHARESNRLRAARAREHDDGVSRCGALSSAALSGRCVLSTYRAEGLAATIGGRGRGAGP